MTENTDIVTPPKPGDDKPVAKKAAAKKATAKKAAATPPKDDKAPANRVYLPTLPKEFAYTSIVATGPDGATVTITPTEDGKGHLRFEGANLDREATYDTMDLAARAAQKAARRLVEIAEAEAKAAKMRQEAFDL